MEKENASSPIEFILTRFTDQLEWKISLCLLFLVVYLITMMGNLGLISVIWNDPRLHTPMYMFLGCLAVVDAWLSSTVTPKMLVSLLANNKRISQSECMIQFFSSAINATTECFLLATMAYDCYLAICNPLLYPVIMMNRLCIQLSVCLFISGILHALVHAGLLFRLTFCKSNLIHHFYCDIITLLKISCTDASINFLIVFIFSGSIEVFIILTILVSYTFILFTVLKKKSVKGIRKDFSTCGSHLFSVYTTAVFFSCMCTLNQDMMDSLFYTVTIPFLNPNIYRLRNKKVIASLAKMLKVKC